MDPIGKAQEQLFAPGTSSRAKYAALVVGRPGFGALLKYELVVLLTQACPGAIGLALRKALYPWLLGSCGSRWSRAGGIGGGLGWWPCNGSERAPGAN